MSRVAKYPITIPSKVNVEIHNQVVVLKGEKGDLSYEIPEGVKVEFLEQTLRIGSQTQMRHSRCLAGTVRANLNNQVKGVSEGFSCLLTLVGVGYRAQVQGQVLILNVGFSQPKSYAIPEGIHIKVPVPTEIIIEGIDIRQVYQVGAEIIRIRPPEPYQGTGIRKKGQIIKLKAAKKK